MDKNWEKWEKFREIKMEKMRAHKKNIEQRMKLEDYGDKGYWTQRNDKLKRYARQETLDSTWYTDNIYSNQSIDLEQEVDDDFEEYLVHHPRNYNKNRDINGNNDTFDPDDYFIYKKKSSTGYPKSKSCCFGSTNYDLKPSIKIPKSQSFSTSRHVNSNFDKIRQIKNNYDCDMIEYPRSLRNRLRRNYSDDDKEDVRNEYLLTRVCDREGCINETCFTKTGGGHHINDQWNEIHKSHNNILCDNNGNQSEYYTADEDNFDDGAICFNDDFFINDHSVYDDDHITARRDSNFNDHQRGFIDDDLDHLIQNERSKLLIQNKLNKYRDDLTYEYNNKSSFEDIFTSSSYKKNKKFPKKNKSLLEVKPPSKYDDSSPDSTDLELDDFNFDFGKYWEELDKTPDPIDFDHQINNNNYNNNLNCSNKIKNVNIGRYNNDDSYLYHHYDDNPIKIMNNPNNNNTMLTVSPIRKFDHKIHPESSNSIQYNNFFSNDSSQSHHHHHHRSNNSNTISLINNIFSIYKPNKYSPLNCHSKEMGHKPEPCKKMNVPSTVRPLGAPENDFMTSLKRPLLVSPQQSSCSTEQARFKIIPDKTGLKISPLYRFDFGGKSQYKLKSTSRPLLFRH